MINESAIYVECVCSLGCSSKFFGQCDSYDNDNKEGEPTEKPVFTVRLIIKNTIRIKTKFKRPNEKLTQKSLVLKQL